MKRCCCILLFSLSIAVSACSGDSRRPFEVVYTSKNDVTITYKGKDYRLNRFQRGLTVPFQYAFENDGDLNLVIEGEEYEIESPFDNDNKKKKNKPTTTQKKKPS